MQAIFIAYDQAHHEAILDLLEKNSCRGFTSFGETQGRGSVKGILIMAAMHTSLGE